MTGRSIAALVFGILAALAGVVLIAGALGPLSEYEQDDGFYMGEPFSFDRPSHAIVTEDIDLLKGRYPDLAADSLLLYLMADPVDVRMQGVASGPDALFVGIAPTPAVDEYLDGVAHDEIVEVERHRESHQIEDVAYLAHEGRATPDDPGTETIWATSATGRGLQTLDWTLESGDWTVVVMNADASSGVAAELAFGAEAPSDVDFIARAMVTVGVISLIGGGLLTVDVLRRRARELRVAIMGPPDGAWAPEAPVAPTPVAPEEAPRDEQSHETPSVSHS